jgi:hypothetical protein
MNTHLLDPLLGLLGRMAEAWSDPRPRPKVPDVALGLLCGEGPATITRALHWLDADDQDWSADYRLFSQAHWAVDRCFAPVLAQAVAYPGGDPAAPLFVGQDDTLIRKSGRTIPGTAWARDALGPPFQVNLVWGQRFLQTALLVKPPGPQRPWRSIPVGFRHAPPLKAPRRATPEQRAAVKEARKKSNLSTAAAEELQHLREQLDQLPHGVERLIIDAVDGGYANRTFLRHLPERTVVVARIRKNARLRAYLSPDRRQGARKYGADLPTPEAYLHDASIPWQELMVFVAGQLRTLRYKVIEAVCWPQTTRDCPLRLIIIKAAGYRLRKGSKLLYRQPAFLITTATTAIDIRQLIEAYLARWELEVNFRDEKSFVGVGQAQVRSPLSVPRAPAFLVACYAALLLVSLLVFDDQRTDAFPKLPAWRKHPPLRPSIRDLVTLLRMEAADYVPSHVRSLAA